MNNKKIYKTLTERGGLMIEALAMLGLIAVVTPTMYKKSAERTLEVEDINTAGAMRTYIGAVDAYIAANYSNLMDKDIHASDYITISNADLAAYLPYNFQAGSLYEFGEPVAKVYRRSNNLTAFVVYPAKSDAAKGIGQERTARIAALVGSNGGYITGTSGGVKARGIGGIWKLEGENYTNVFGGTAAAEPNVYSIVISSSNVVNGENLGEEGEQTKFLQRTKENGENQEWRNTMRTDLYMGGNQNTSTGLDDDGDETKSQTKYSIRNINSLIVGAEKVTDGEGNEMDYGLFINKTGTNPNAFIGGTLEAAFNEANNKARFLVSDGDIDMNEHVTTDNISGLYSTAPGEITVSVDGKVRVNEELIAKQVDTGKVRATEFEVGSDKIDDTNKWLKVDAEGIQVNGMVQHNGTLPTIYTTAGITNGNVEIKTKNDSDSRGNEFVLNDSGTSRTAGLKSTGQNTYYGISTEATDVSGKTTGHVALESGDWKLQISGSQTASADNKVITAEFGDSAKINTAPSYNKATNRWEMHDKTGDNGAKAGTVFVRKGMLDVTGDKAQDRGTNNKPTSTNAADDGTGIVMANRFVANNLDKDGNLVKVPDLLTSSARTTYGSGDNRYDTYMVNPAYTSVMNDIKLTTRGGARLSDILPDFITKGIYVATNSKDEDTSLTFNESNLSAQLDSLGKAGDGSLTSDDNYASPYTGVVPAPPCPPGYSRVITVTPSSFQMAQAGSLNLSNTSKPYVENKNLANAPSTLVEPEYNALELKSKNSGTISGGKITIEDVTPPISNKNVSINNATLADNMMKLSHNNKDVYVLSADQVDGKHHLKPLVFQQSTWLKSLVVPIKTGKSSSYGNVPPGGYTRGWAVLMGFLYPANEYTKFTKTLKIDLSGNAYWNIFPVKKYTLEGYATTYCYFDRDNAFGDFKLGYDNYVDKYDVFENTTDFKPYNKAYRQNLNDPSLKYDELW
ncbi:MAG: hypothetical protein IJ525_00465 [Alphaproteobacteria bacterium]|nr:hypothetical protein [Alphaproteobacteria bacterium]